MLELADYRDVIHLDEPFPKPDDDPRRTHDLLMTALAGLRDKQYTGNSSISHLSTNEGLLRWLNAELSQRKPGPIDPITSRAINTLLYRQMANNGRVEAANLPRIFELMPECDYDSAREVVLVRADMTQLVVDAIVNTAMPEFTGCPIPLHHCLDSEVHDQAGPWLKNDTAKLMELQGTETEAPGHAKITRGYRLPAKYVIHTVTPDVRDGNVEKKDKKELYNCYWNSLDLANEMGNIRTIAFPTLATGLHGFPLEDAADIALTAIEDWLHQRNTNINLVVLAVYSEEDTERFTKVLSQWVDD